MQTMQRAQQLNADAAQKTNYAFIGGGFIVFGFSLVVLIVKPELIRAFGSSALGALPSPPWVIPTLSIGVALGASALSWVAIARFLKEVHVAPYAWTAPFLGLVAGAFMANSKAILPFGFNPLPFAAATILVILAGGALSSMKGVWHMLCGVTLCVLPIGFLLINLAIRNGGLMNAFTQTDSETRFFLFVLSISSIVIGALPFLPDSGSTSSGKLRESLKEARWRLSLMEQENFQLLADRDRLLNERAVYDHASAQLQAQQTAMAQRLSLAQDEAADAAALRRRGIPGWIMWASAGILLGSALFSAYLLMYKPMVARQAVLVRALNESEQKLAGVLAKVNQERDTERAKAEATIAEQRDELIKARKQVVETIQAAQAPKTEPAALVQSKQSAKSEPKLVAAKSASKGSAAKSEPKVSVKAKLAKAKPIARAPVRKAVRAPERVKAKAPSSANASARTKTAPAEAPTSDDPILGLEGM
jgi:hypothetical protein